MDDDLKAELLALEERFWQAGGSGDLYRELMIEDGLMVMPFGIGVLDRTEVADAIDRSAPWARFEMGAARLLELGEGAALLTYRVSAERRGEPVYLADATSVYVKRVGGWHLAFHQQTPLPAG